MFMIKLNLGNRKCVMAICTVKRFIMANVRYMANSSKPTLRILRKIQDSIHEIKSGYWPGFAVKHESGIATASKSG